MGDGRAIREYLDRDPRQVGRSAILFINSLVEQIGVANSITDGFFFNLKDGMFGPEVLPFLTRINLAPGAFDPDSGSRLPKQASGGLVVGAFSFGEVSGSQGKIDSSIVGMIKHVKYIAPDGVGVFLIKNYYSAFVNTSLETLLADEGFHLHAVVNPPQRILDPVSAMRPIVVVVGRSKPERVFFLDSANGADALLGLEGFFNKHDSDDLASGVWRSLDEFPGFEAWHLRADLEAIGGDYTTYEEYTLSEISLGVNSCRTGQDFTHIENAIYIPLLGPSPAVGDLSIATLKHQNYAQVILDESKVSSEFVLNFLNSKYGRAILKYEKEHAGAVIPRMNLGQLKRLRVSLPPLKTQLDICSTIVKLAHLRALVMEIEENISISPVSSTESVHQIDLALEVFGQLTVEDQIRSKIRRGESKVTEFKQTLRMDIRDGSVQKHLEESAFKTIAAFLNSDGGDLFIGVSDDGKIVGVQDEIDRLFGSSADKYLLHFKNLLKSRIGEQFYPLIDQKIIDLRGRKILHVNCEESSTEVFINDNFFYVRTNPATDRLEGQKLVAYIRQRFGYSQDA